MKSLVQGHHAHSAVPLAILGREAAPPPPPDFGLLGPHVTALLPRVWRVDWHALSKVGTGQVVDSLVPRTAPG